MIPKEERHSVNQREMARGQEIQARNERRQLVDDWVFDGKLNVDTQPLSSQERITSFYIGFDLIVTIAEDSDYPSEQLVAQLALAIEALQPLGNGRHAKAERQRERDHTYREQMRRRALQSGNHDDFKRKF